MKNSNSKTRDALLALLRKHIDECVAARDEMDQTIEALLEAERKLLQGEGPDLPLVRDEPEDLPYRIQPSPTPEVESITEAETKHTDQVEELPPFTLEEQGEPPRRSSRKSVLTSDSLLLEEDTYSLVPDRSKIPDASSPPDMTSPGQLDELIEEDQIHLLKGSGVREKRTREEEGEAETPLVSAPPKQSLPFQHPIDPLEDLDPPTRRSANRPQPALNSTQIDQPGESLLPPSLQQLMNHIRSGGAIRCLDPWEQTCGAFLLSSTGSTVFATDVFMNYLRKSLNNFRNLFLQKTEQDAAATSNFSPFEELRSKIRFLSEFVKVLQEERTASLASVEGLRVSGSVPLPQSFEFENSTIDFIHSGLMNALHELMQGPVDSFFETDGPYSQIAEFLSKLKDFIQDMGEEQKAAAMLSQLGLEGASSSPRQADELGTGDREKNPETSNSSSTLAASDDIFVPPADAAAFMEEADQLQDLKTFDFEPDDKKSIMGQDEKALSSSDFKRIEKVGQPEEKMSPQPQSKATELGAISPAEIAPISEGEKEGSFSSMDDIEKMFDEGDGSKNPTPPSSK